MLIHIELNYDSWIDKRPNERSHDGDGKMNSHKNLRVRLDFIIILYDISDYADRCRLGRYELTTLICSNYLVRRTMTILVDIVVVAR